MERLKGRGSIRGVMFTLVTVVVVVLLLGEVLTYLYTNTQYSNLGIQATPSVAAGSMYQQVQGGAPAFLQASLTKAVYALNAYETTNGANGISNGAYALSSLIDNGTLYGANMVGYMGGYTLSSYANALEVQASGKGLNIGLSNLNAFVFQNSPGRIGVSLSTTLNVSSPYGIVSYPITANASVPMAGLPDLYGGSLGTGAIAYSQNLSATVNASYAALLSTGSIYNGIGAFGNSVVSGGSRSPYLFAYGPLFVDNSATPNCGDGSIANVPAASRSGYILAVSNGLGISSTVCGFAGLITHSANSVQPTLKPYLVYANANMISYLGTGNTYLLGEKALYDVSPLQGSVYRGAYVNSTFSPTYLSFIGGAVSSFSPYGVAPLGVATRQVASFSSHGNVTATSIPVNTLTGGYNTASFWMQWPTNSVNLVPLSFNAYSIYVTSTAIGFSSSSGNMLGTFTGGLGTFSLTPWVHVVAGFSNSGAANDVLYINGVRQNLQFLKGTLPSASVGSKVSLGGFSSASYNSFNGMMADVQLYNSLLSPYQAYSLYTSGINGAPINYSYLVGWWPLNGNLNDYSHEQDNGVANQIGAVSYASLSGYGGSTLGGGSFYSTLTGGVQGISQCYGVSSCSWNGAGKIYAPVPQGYATSNVQLPSSSLGFINSTIPGSAYFNPALDNEFIGYNIPLAASDTVSFWMDWVPNGNTGYPVYFGGVNEGLSVSGGGLSCAGGGGGSVPAATVQGHWVNIIAGNGNLYVNGSSMASSCSFSGTSIDPVYIGGISGGGYFSGSISDVQVYNSALTGAQIAQLYLNNTVNSISPIAWWPLGSGNNGFTNQTAAITGNYAVEYNSVGLCSEANSLGLGSSCGGVLFLPFGPR